MTIKKTKSGKFQVRLEAGYSLSGKRQQISKTFNTLRKAKQFELDNDTVDNDRFSSKTTLKEFVEVVYLPLKKDTVRASTFKAYGYYVVVDPTITPENGDIGAFTINGDIVMRKVLRGANTLILAPESFNESIQDIVPSGDSEIKTLGKVVWYQAAEEL